MTSYDWELFNCVHEVWLWDQVPLIEFIHYMMTPIWLAFNSRPVYVIASSKVNAACVFLWRPNSLNSFTTLLGGKTSRKALWTWTCSWGGLMKFSFGWSQRCVCVLSSTRGCSFSRSSSRLLPSKWTLFRCLAPLTQFALMLIQMYLFMHSLKAVRSTGTWTPSLLSQWD